MNPMTRELTVTLTEGQAWLLRYYSAQSVVKPEDRPLALSATARLSAALNALPPYEDKPCAQCENEMLKGIHTCGRKF